MNIDSTDRFGFTGNALGGSNGMNAVPAEAGTALPDDIDDIKTSPLAYFGSIVEQLGKSMTAEGISASQNGSDASYGVHNAIDMLEGITSMMSLYATGGDGAGPDLQSALDPASIHPALDGTA